MATVDVTVETAVSRSVRARQMEGMFDVPSAPHQKLSWQFDAPLEERDWSVGLIVGPSGSGKSTVAKHLFGPEKPPTWGEPSVVDDFSADLSMQDVATVCQAVGFNTIPAWLRPYDVLSTGERFRVDLARRLAESTEGETIMVDEFTSVVDRQVAKIGANAAQKWVRKKSTGRRFVAVSCHYDVLDWLQPDWVIEPAERRFSWRSVQPRPPVEVTIAPVGYEAWRLFAPYHYLTANLAKAARCYCAFVGDEPVAFAGVMRRPHPKAKNIMGVSRLVTLPDWQGLGLAFALVDKLGSAYKAVGERLHTYPAHPALIHGFDRSPVWSLKQRPGYGGGRPSGGNAGNGAGRKGGGLKSGNAANAATRGFAAGDGQSNRSRAAYKAPASQANARTKAARENASPNARGIVHGPNAELTDSWRHGSRPCAVFEYAGQAIPLADARRLMKPYLKGK